MNEAVYDKIGIRYTKYRSADRRIVNSIKDLLGLPAGSTIADIGAGSGNYSNALAEVSFKVKAIEPSEVMQKQAIKHNDVTWYSGNAEAIPLTDNSVDGVAVILAMHHFISITDITKEFRRICPNGPVVIFTFDPRESEEFWFTEYFPAIWQQAFDLFPPIDVIAKTITHGTRWVANSRKFPLPSDLSDKFMAAEWCHPEMYLNKQVRQSMSGFALADQDIVQRGIDLLEKDLQSGRWNEKYGHIRERKYFDAGYRFIKLTSSDRHNKPLQRTVTAGAAPVAEL